MQLVALFFSQHLRKALETPSKVRTVDVPCTCVTYWNSESPLASSWISRRSLSSNPVLCCTAWRRIIAFSGTFTATLATTISTKRLVLSSHRPIKLHHFMFCIVSILGIFADIVSHVLLTSCGIAVAYVSNALWVPRAVQKMLMQNLLHYANIS